MASMILKLTKLAGWSIGIYWALIALFVIFDPSLPPSIFIAPWGLDWAAVVIFVASISIILYLIRDLNKRRHVKQTTTIKMLLLAFFAFLLALAMSLLVEFLFTVDLVNNYLNRSIFIFTAFGLMCWYLFVIDIFEGGLHWPFESATLPRKTFIKNWIMSIVLFGMVVIFMIFLTKSIWTKLNIVEMMLQTIPVLIITIFDMVSLLYKPFKMVKKVETKRERIGLLGLFLSGIILLAFLVTYIVHNLSNQALDPIAAYHARGIFYYLSMIMIPVYCIFNYIGLIYPVKEK